VKKVNPNPRPKSALHRRVAELFRSLFPQFKIFEEESIDVVVDGRRTTLFVDIIVRELSLVIECHGRQHFEFVPHFHQTRDGFARSVQRDRAKADAVIAAGYSYLVVRYDQESQLTPELLMTMATKALEKT
jgi:hypothetical protein